jgi:hypothetical protein
MSYSKNQIVWFNRDYNKHVYEWKFSVLEGNDVIIEAQLVMESKSNL